jgi:hypothetical protein
MDDQMRPKPGEADTDNKGGRACTKGINSVELAEEYNARGRGEDQEKMKGGQGV